MTTSAANVSYDPYRLCDLQLNWPDERRASLYNPLPSDNMFNKFRSSFGRSRKLSNRTSTMQPAPRVQPSSAKGHVSADAPPAYSPVVNAAPAAASSQPEADDPYSFLSSFDTIFLIDNSGSMAGSRWKETKEAIETIAPVCTQHDEDGIDIYFLNRNASEPDRYENVTSTARVNAIFKTVKPFGGTKTGTRLNDILRPYLDEYAAKPNTTKPINIIVITDGEAQDDVESTLIAAAKKLDKLEAPAWQVGVQFFQVGRDEQATKHLRELDDELANIAGDSDLRDMVDTVPFRGEEGARLTGDGVLKVVLGSVVRRLDRKRSHELHR